MLRLIIQVFETLLNPIDITRYPETFGPKDDDPLVPLTAYLTRSAPANSALEGWLEVPRVSKASIKVAFKYHQAFNKMGQANGYARVMAKLVGM